MPIYEYECTKCGNRFERLQKVSDPPMRSCPDCRGRVEKLIHAPGIHFKGSGWYVTDYSDQRKKDSRRTQADEPAAGKDKKTDTAPKDAGTKKASD